MGKKAGWWKTAVQLSVVLGICCLGICYNGVQSSKENREVYIREEQKKIAITFDDGPDEIYTKELLDGLQERGVRATFFVIGREAEKQPDLIRRMHEEGHLIGNHTYHHVELTKMDPETEKKEIEKTNAVIEKITGEKVVFIRPPYGAMRDQTMDSMRLIPVKWDIDPLDWCTKSTVEIVRKVVTQAKENGIILLHDCYGTSVQAGLQIIDLLQEQGYHFVTVDELIIG